MIIILQSFVRATLFISWHQKAKNGHNFKRYRLCIPIPSLKKRPKNRKRAGQSQKSS